jgi:hypothetical protein
MRFFAAKAHTQAPVPVVEQTEKQPHDEEKQPHNDEKQPHDDEKHATLSRPDSDDQAVASDSESIDPTLQYGVKAIEATTTVWPMSHLILAYVLCVLSFYRLSSQMTSTDLPRRIWIIAFIDTMQQGMSFALTPYVTSSFNQHGLTATTSVMSGLIGGIFKLPLAKILDIWGRPQGFALMAFFVTIGLIMMAGCNNVQTYAAAQVFYWVGYARPPPPLSG